MENKLLSYYKLQYSIEDKKKKAQKIMELLLADLSNLKKDIECKPKIEDLDFALERYFCRRQHQYAIRMLNHYIISGNTNIEVNYGAQIHQTDKYLRIRKVITELFVDDKNVCESMNGSGIIKGG